MIGDVNASLALRPITPADRELLYRIYAGTRAEELAVTGWDDSQKAAFLQMQFDAQHRYYMENYRDARFQVIEWDRAPVGRLYLVRWSDEIRIIDIALMPEYRGRGLGTQLMLKIQADARQAGLPVTIHVERFNPALSLYERLGFRVIEDKGVYLLMKWTPAD
jgi:ribosomal protein S18 acetylase RimI-like enzyme